MPHWHSVRAVPAANPDISATQRGGVPSTQVSGSIHPAQAREYAVLASSGSMTQSCELQLPSPMANLGLGSI